MKSTASALVITILLTLSFDASAHQDNKLVIESKILKETRKISISLPENYSDSTQKYPLILVLDSETNIGHIREAVNMLYQSGYPQAIVAGIENVDRSRDFTFSASEEAPQSGGAINFLNFLSIELLPELTNRYRLSGHKTLFGHSAGGLFGGFVLIQEPDLFNAMILVSPTFRWNNFSIMQKLADAINRLKKPLRIHLAYGNESGLEREGFIKFESLLTNNPQNVKYQISSHPQEEHNTVPYLGAYEGLKTVFGAFKAPDFLYHVPLPKVMDYYMDVATEFGVDARPPQRFLLTRGENERNAKLYETSIETFKLFAKLYPDNPLPLIQLATTYEASGKLELALKIYLKSKSIMNWPQDLDSRIERIKVQIKSDK